MKNLLTRLLLTLFISSPAYSQLDSVFYQGPSSGSVSSGAMQTTDNFGNDSPFFSGEEFIINPPLERTTDDFQDMIYGWDQSKLPDYRYIEDTHVITKAGNGNQTVLLNSFNAIPMTNFIPPDPVIAAGPNHIIVCANSIFRILDKEGNVLKIIPADEWWNPAWSDERGDPQVLYDFYEDKWILVWMQYNSNSQTAGNLIAYSDDENPIGTWYMYRLDTKMHGTVPSNTWGDYPHAGFDEEAIYISTRSVDFAGAGHQYNKIRIISKSELYNSNGGALSYTDLWDIRKPGEGAAGPVLDYIHPGISYTPGNGGWFFWARGVYGGNPVSADFYVIYKIENPLTSPSIKGKVLPVQTYTSPPLANQLGGGLGIETIGWITRQPVIRDGNLYTSHDIQNSIYPDYSSIKFLKIDLNTIAISENVEYGSEGFFYLFPALTVDKDYNIAVTFSRSADTEYIGAYYTTWHENDPSGFKASLPFAEGKANYVLTFGGTINRWGDYFGIYLDPANEYDFWMISEYAAANNVWGTYVAQVRMVPFPGIYSFYYPGITDFEDVEVDNTSEEKLIVISNYGEDDLIISDIDSDVGPFNRTSTHSFPITLNSYDSVFVSVEFSPTVAGYYDELLPVSSNDTAFTGIRLAGNAFDMLAAFRDIFYASTGPGNNGDILTVSKETGAGTTLGNSLFSEISSITVHPDDNIMFGLAAGANNSDVVRINAGGGDSYTLYEVELPLLSAIAFSNSGLFYMGQQTGEIYTLDILNGNLEIVDTLDINLNAFAFHPVTGELWAAKRKIIGAGKDEIYKIDLATGETTLIGSTGFGVLTNDLAFDENNRLYGVIGSASESGKLIEISTIDGSGTLIGEIGFNNVIGLGYSIGGPVNSVEEYSQILPKEYSLYQNYPNPFNPVTKIKYEIPQNSFVKIVLFDVLGNEIKNLVSEMKSAGKYELILNASNLTSGVYFYELRATPNGGQVASFTETKKMVLIK
jgi:hypothetical protein